MIRVEQPAVHHPSCPVRSGGRAQCICVQLYERIVAAIMD